MRIEKTNLSGVVLIKPKIFEDQRGHFFEAFRREFFEEHGLEFDFCQDNISTSAKGTVRGLHYQMKPHAQAKLVMAVKGTILDVAVDIRKESPTFGHHFSTVLNDENRHMMLVPEGFAHGFSVLSEKATVYYKCNRYYHKKSERGVRWDDPSIGVDWKTDTPILSGKDRELPLLNEVNQEDLF